MREILNVRSVLQEHFAFLKTEDLKSVKMEQKTAFLKHLCLFLLMITIHTLIEEDFKVLDSSK